MSTLTGIYKGYEIRFEGISYQCRELGLYGYRNDLELTRAITRKLGARKAKETKRAHKLATLAYESAREDSAVNY